MLNVNVIIIIINIILRILYAIKDLVFNLLKLEGFGKSLD